EHTFLDYSYAHLLRCVAVLCVPVEQNVRKAGRNGRYRTSQTVSTFQRAGACRLWFHYHLCLVRLGDVFRASVVLHNLRDAVDREPGTLGSGLRHRDPCTPGRYGTNIEALAA